MADPLALVSDLERRLRVEVGSLAGADLLAAEDAIADVSALVHAAARDAGLSPAWTLGTVPDDVRVVTTRVALRQYRNPDGYVSEAMGGGAYSYRYADDETGAYLTDREVAIIAAAAAGTDPAPAGFVGSLRTPSAYTVVDPAAPEDPWWW